MSNLDKAYFWLREAAANSHSGQIALAASDVRIAELYIARAKRMGEVRSA